MTLEHFSSPGFKIDKTKVYEQRMGPKPRGFWVSVRGDDDWPTWCKAESFRQDRLEHRSMVTLTEDANILHLRNVSQIAEFAEKYRENLLDEPPAYWVIDWTKVVRDYDGIVIAPYQWSIRLEMSFSWYYGWDVSSGCIWNLNAIKDVFEVIADPIGELDNLAACLAYNAEVMLENAENRAAYGTDDPTGGKGRLPLTLAQWKDDFFKEWINRENPVPRTQQPTWNKGPAHAPARSGRGYLSTRP